MPSISLPEAGEQLARYVETADADTRDWIAADYYLPKTSPAPPAAELARYLRTELYPEEVAELWPVVFLGHRGVYYNEVTDALHFDEEWVEAAD